MRSWRRRLAACVLVTGFAAGAWAQPAAAPAANQQEIDQLIAQLSSPDEAVRTKAQEKLVTMGDQARAALEAYIRAKTAAEATLARIEMNKVAGPTLVSINMNDAIPEAVINELAKQTMYTIQPFSDNIWGQINASNISVAMEKQPFWAAMREVCGKSGLSIQAGWGFGPGAGGDRRITLVPAGAGMGNVMKFPASLNGAFMVVLSGMSRNSSIDLSNPQQSNNNVNVSLSVCIEPKVKITQYSFSPNIEEAVDDKGNSLLPASRPDFMDRSMMSSARGSMFQMNAGLLYPASNAGQRIARLRGKLRFMAQKSSEVLEVADILKAKDVTKTVAGNKITIKEVKRINDRQYEVALVVARDGADPRAYNELVQQPAIKLVDEQDNLDYAWSGQAGAGDGGGRRVVMMPFGAAGSGEVRWLFVYRGTVADGPVTGEPTKLIWEVPTGNQEITVPFEFKDLPLP